MRQRRVNLQVMHKDRKKRGPCRAYSSNSEIFSTITSLAGPHTEAPTLFSLFIRVFAKLSCLTKSWNAMETILQMAHRQILPAHNLSK